MKKISIAAIVSLLGAVWADDLVSVTSVTAHQRYPWSGLVDIVVTIEGASNDVAEADCFFAATNTATQAGLSVAHIMRNGSDSGSGTTWTRRFIWDAVADVGAVKIDDMSLTVDAQLPDYVQLWENGPYWAKCNVGASKPEEYGYYFWWGDTAGYRRNANNDGWMSVSNGTSFSFVPSICPTYGKNDSALLSAGYIDEEGNLVLAYDAATVYLGAPWRMPTATEFDNLISNCTTTWTVRNGVYGQLVTGKGSYASKSIFLPAGGNSNGSDIVGVGVGCRYWSSLWSVMPPYAGSSGYAWCLLITSSRFEMDYSSRYYGQPIRPLREFIYD